MNWMKQATAVFLSLLILLSCTVHVFARTDGAVADEGAEAAKTAELDMRKASCEVCGQKDGHLETCVYYVPEAPEACPECRQTEGHLPTCSYHTVNAVEDDILDYSGDVGKLATFNIYNSDTGTGWQTFELRNDTAQGIGETKTFISYRDVSDGVVVEIAGWHIDSANALWYKVKAPEGYSLPNVLESFPWVYQKLQGTDEMVSLILQAKPAPEEPNEVTGTVDGSTVTVSGRIPKDTELKLASAELSAIPGYDSETKFGIGNRAYIAMDISLLRNGTEYQPDGSVSITMDVGSNVANNGEDVLIVHVHENADGTTTDEVIGPCKVANGKITFEMTSFSYVLVFNSSIAVNDAKAFYPGAEFKISGNSQWAIVGIYYDTNDAAHLLLGKLGNGKLQTDKIIYVSVNGESYYQNPTGEQKPCEIKFYDGRMTEIALKDEGGNTITSFVGDATMNGCLDIKLVGDVPVTRLFSLKMETSTGGSGGDNAFDISGPNGAPVTIELALQYSISKKVALGATANENTQFYDSITVQRGDQIIYQIDINNSGLVELHDMLVTDILPTGVFVEGTVLMSIDGEDGAIGSWQKFDSVLFDDYQCPGEKSRKLYITGQVRADLDIKTDTTYTNTASIDGLNMPTYSDTANIIVEAPKSGELTVSKAVTTENPNDPAPEDAVFTFTITSNGQLASSLRYMLNDGEQDVEERTVASDGTFTLKDGESAKFSAFPVGAFTVTEKAEQGYTTRISGDSDGVVNGLSYSYTMEGDASPVVAFVNQWNLRTKSLTITKEVEKEYENDVLPNDEFTFEVVFGDGTDTQTAYPYTVNDEPKGTVKSGGTITLKGGETAGIEDVPVGTHYTITETTSADYTTTVNGTETNVVSGNISSSGNSETFTNTYKRHRADLTIKKEMGDGKGIDQNQSFIFTVEGVDNGLKMEVVIHGTGSITLKDIPVGQYTVTENTDWSWQYTPSLDVDPVVVTAGGDNTVTVTNQREKNRWLFGDCFAENQFAVKPKSEDED